MAAGAALVGPTASGKSALALELARRHEDVELVSLDSMQVDRGMDIGTAKPTSAEQAEVPHHLIDLVDPDEEMTVARFQQEYRRVVADIAERGHRALLVGGTGLYVRAVVDDLDIPGQYPDVRADLEAEPDTAALHEKVMDAAMAIMRSDFASMQMLYPERAERASFACWHFADSIRKRQSSGNGWVSIRPAAPAAPRCAPAAGSSRRTSRPATSWRIPKT